MEFRVSPSPVYVIPAILVVGICGLQGVSSIYGYGLAILADYFIKFFSAYALRGDTCKWITSQLIELKNGWFFISS